MADRYLMPIVLSLIICFNYFVIKFNNIYKIKTIYFFLALIITTSNIYFSNINLKKNIYVEKKYSEETNNIIKFINTGPEKSSFLIDGGHIYKYYTKNKFIDHLTFPNNEVDPNFLLRENRNYLNIQSRILNSYYDYIIIEKRRKYTDHKINMLNENYSLKETEIYKIFSLLK